MHKKLRYYLLFIILSTIVAACGKKQDPLPPLNETYTKKDKNPFGTYIAYNQMEYLFPHNTIFVKKQSFETTWREINDTKALYVSISKNLFLTNADVRAIMDFVSAGNTMFISSNSIDEKLLDTLGCIVTTAQDLPYIAPDMMNYTHIGLEESLFHDTTKYRFFYYPFDNKFAQYDSVYSKVLGVNENGAPILYYIFTAKGNSLFILSQGLSVIIFYYKKIINNIYSKRLHTPMPHLSRYFGMIFIAEKNYATSDGEAESSFSMLTKYPALKWAFWLTLLMLLLYIFFSGKRRQRVIELIPPNTNTTVAFTETVGRLYLQSKNNRNIADKMILYFFEQIRTQFFLNANHINEEFIDTLSRKSNVPIEITRKLFKTIQQIQNNFDITDQQLLSLNNQIEHFNKIKI